MRYEIVAETKEGHVRNVFKDGRSFTSKNYAQRKMDELQAIFTKNLSIRYLENEFTDTQRLNWMIENEQAVVKSKDDGKWCTLTGDHWFSNPRDTIDAAMTEEKNERTI